MEGGALEPLRIPIGLRMPASGMGAEVAGKGIWMLNLDVGGVTGGRSVCGVAEGGDGGPRELRVGTQGSAYESLRKLRMWGSRRQSRGIQTVRG